MNVTGTGCDVCTGTGCDVCTGTGVMYVTGTGVMYVLGPVCVVCNWEPPHIKLHGLKIADFCILVISKHPSVCVCVCVFVFCILHVKWSSLDGALDNGSENYFLPYLNRFGHWIC